MKKDDQLKGDQTLFHPKSDSSSDCTMNDILVGPGEWVRPLGHLETFMEVAGKYGSLNTVQAIWLSSKQPINPAEVHKAVLHIAQKVQILQLCIQRRRLKPWFKRLKEVVCEYDVVEDDVMAVFRQQLRQPYNLTDGPLWRTKLVPVPQQSPEDPYQASLIFSAHHCIIDGYTIMHFFRTILELLNSAFTGRVYEVPIYPVRRVVAEELWKKRDWHYLFTYVCSMVYNKVLFDYSSKLYFNGALKQPQNNTTLTEVLRKNFTAEETKKIIQHCKDAGVAVHSCIMATANLALLRTAQHQGKHKIEAVRICTVNCIDMRRYFPDELKDSLGCHISLEETEMPISRTSADSKKQFWSLVKEFQSNLNDTLNVKFLPQRNGPLFRISTLFLHLNHELTRSGRKNKTHHHLCSTNMGNLKNLLPAKYNGPVEITDLLRASTNEFIGNPFILAFHTFNDCLMISLNYHTTVITAEDAEIFFSIFEKYISNIAKYGNVQDLVSSNYSNRDPASYKFTELK